MELVKGQTLAALLPGKGFGLGKFSVITGPREKHDFWKLSLADGKVSRLTKLEGRRGNIGATFATDNRYLYFTWREDDGDIWVMDVVTDTAKNPSRVESLKP